MKIEGSVALITGGVSGLGLSTAELLLSRGASGVILLDRNATLGQKVEKELGPKAKFIQVDVADESSV